jgi:acetyl esterase/lipase
MLLMNRWRIVVLVLFSAWPNTTDATKASTHKKEADKTDHTSASPRSRRRSEVRHLVTRPPRAVIVAVALAVAWGSSVARVAAAEPVVPPGMEWQAGIEFARPGDVPLPLNLARPAAAGAPRPAVLCIHGGGLRHGTRTSYNRFCLELATRGYVAATIDYRLVPQHPFPAAIHDAKAAVRWLRANAVRLGIDPQRIGATGQSAGGYLALFLGLTPDVPRFEGSGGNPDQSSAVACVVNVYGPTDLVSDWDTSEDGKALLPLWFGGPLDTHRSAYIEGSPLSWATPAAAPTLCIHGTADRLVAYEQSQWLVERLQKAGVEAELVTIEGAGHGFKDADRDRADAALLSFLNRHLTP